MRTRLSAGQLITMVGHLEGCLRDVRFHGERLLYLDATARQPGVTVTNVNVRPGCRGGDVCAAAPCPTNAFCNDTWNDFECPCMPGWEGKTTQSHLFL